MKTLILLMMCSMCAAATPRGPRLASYLARAIVQEARQLAVAAPPVEATPVITVDPAFLAPSPYQLQAQDPDEEN